MVIYIVLAIIVAIIIAFILYKKKRVKEMPQGLQIWDSNGNLILSTNDRVTKIVGIVRISENGFVTDEQLNQGTIWYAPCNYSQPASSGYLTFPEIKIEGTTIKWTYPSTNRRVEMDLIYGVY